VGRETFGSVSEPAASGPACAAAAVPVRLTALFKCPLSAGWSAEMGEDGRGVWALSPGWVSASLFVCDISGAH